MRDFASGGSAAALSRPAKVLYTAFAFLNLCGLVSSVVLYDGFVDFDARATPSDLYRRLTAHYETIDRRTLLEVTHAHLFSMPVLLLVSGHLVLLTSLSLRFKLTLIIIGVIAMTLHLLAPWVVRWSGGSGGAGLLYPISGGLLFVSLAAMTCIPAWEMWRPRRRA